MKVHLPAIKIFIFGKNGSLLLVLTAIFCIFPFVETQIGKYLVEFLFIAVLLAGLRAVDVDSRFFRFCLLILIVGLVLGFLGTWYKSVLLFGLGSGADALVLFLISLTILTNLFRGSAVTGDTLAGAVCIYLMIAVIWGYFYLLTELCAPGSFSFTQAESVRNQMLVSQQFYPFFYFSLITMTTVGYGDMLPITPMAQTLATLEALVGQVYLTILVARLVGMYMLNQQEEKQ